MCEQLAQVVREAKRPGLEPATDFCRSDVPTTTAHTMQLHSKILIDSSYSSNSSIGVFEYSVQHYSDGKRVEKCSCLSRVGDATLQRALRSRCYLQLLVSAATAAAAVAE